MREREPIRFRPLLGRALTTYELELVKTKLMLRLARIVQRDEKTAKEIAAMKDQGF